MPFPADMATASWKQPFLEYILQVIFKMLIPNTGSIH